jgi:hypothetical protein
VSTQSGTTAIDAHGTTPSISQLSELYEFATGVIVLPRLLLVGILHADATRTTCRARNASQLASKRATFFKKEDGLTTLTYRLFVTR